MEVTHCKKRILTIILVFAIFMSFTNFIFAEELSITLEDSMEKALSFTHRLSELDRSMDSTLDAYGNLKESEQKINAILERINDYKRIYDKKKNGEMLDQLESLQLAVYLETFGPQPPELSKTEMFNTYIKPRDFPGYSTYATYKNLLTTRKLTEAAIKAGVRQLFDSILNMQDAIGLQKQLYDNMLKQDEQLKAKFKAGTVTETDLLLSGNSLKQQKLRIEKSKRSMENLKMSFKKMTGIPLTQQITLAPYAASEEYILKSYDYYLNKALTNRSEILTAKVNFDIKERELNIIKEYITDELTNERLEAQHAYDEKQIACNEAADRVKADIYDGYRDVLDKKNNLNMSKKKLDNAQKQYDNAQFQYNKGLISAANLNNIQAAVTQAQIDVKSSSRNYVGAIYRLENACSIGPGYN